jgi:hypothetical protein
VKRLLNISLAILYLAFNAGALLNFHFCGDSFHHFTVITEPENCCGGDCSCCHNSSYELKVKDKYDSQSTIAFVTPPIGIALSPNFDFYISDTIQVAHKKDAIEPGPLIQGNKNRIHLRNRVILV